MINCYQGIIVILLIWFQIILGSHKFVEATKSNSFYLGKVTECTLGKPVTTITVNNRSYCTKSAAKNNYKNAVSYCKSLNSRLPAPKNSEEWGIFYKSLYGTSWLGVTDPSKSGNWKNWKNIYDNSTIFIKKREFVFTCSIFSHEQNQNESTQPLKVGY